MRQVMGVTETRIGIKHVTSNIKGNSVSSWRFKGNQSDIILDVPLASLVGIA
jgi:hypothetical protein